MEIQEQTINEKTNISDTFDQVIQTEIKVKNSSQNSFNLDLSKSKGSYLVKLSQDSENAQNENKIENGSGFFVEVQQKNQMFKQAHDKAKRKSILSHQSTLKDQSGLIYNTNTTNVDITAIADIFKAELHRKARRIKKSSQQEAERCECCENYIKGIEFNISCNLKELIDLGEGIPLFFFFIKFAIYMLVLAFFPFGLVILILA